jgi:ATP-dependent exoDNAse (exonuclease V) alpha subunit
VLLDDSGGASRVCTREWLYTAISRFKRHCTLIGRDSTAQAMVNRTALDKRKTFLADFIKNRIRQGS